MKTVTVTAGFPLAFASLGAHAQLQSRTLPNGGIESFTFQSPSMGVRFSINIGLPPGYKAGVGSTEGRCTGGSADVMGTFVVRGLRTLYTR